MSGSCRSGEDIYFITYVFPIYYVVSFNRFHR